MIEIEPRFDKVNITTQYTAPSGLLKEKRARLPNIPLRFMLGYGYYVAPRLGTKDENRSQEPRRDGVLRRFDLGFDISPRALGIWSPAKASATLRLRRIRGMRELASGDTLRPRGVGLDMRVRLGFLSVLAFVGIFSSAILSGCGSSTQTVETGKTSGIGIPETPSHVGAVKITVVYPEEGSERPAVDSNFIFGSVGSGSASLIINDVRVPVAKNGAFLAFLRLPKDGGYSLNARDSNSSDAVTLHYGPHESKAQSDAATSIPARRKNALTPYTIPRLGIVKAGRDTLATGSDATPASPSLGGDRKWIWPDHAHVEVLGKAGADYLVKLTEIETAWVSDTSLDVDSTKGVRAEQISAMTIEPNLQFVDIKFAATFAPFLVNAETDAIELTLYNRFVSKALTSLHPDPLLGQIILETKLLAGPAQFLIKLNKPLWGFKIFYERDGSLVLRIRRPPKLDQDEPLRGLRIMLDPGHPPGGAIGPTGLTEAEANLAIALRIRDRLLARGAIVLMTRTTDAPMRSSVVAGTELWARVDSAVSANVDLLLSIHNNGFPDGVNPFLNFGTSSYYYHPFSSPLAAALEKEIAGMTGIPSLGSRQKSLALVRPTWMPSALTESLYMMFPDQEAALRDPKFLDKLAEAHVRGLEAFLRSRAKQP